MNLHMKPHRLIVALSFAAVLAAHAQPATMRRATRIPSAVSPAFRGPNAASPGAKEHLFPESVARDPQNFSRLPEGFHRRPHQAIVGSLNRPLPVSCFFSTLPGLDRFQPHPAKHIGPSSRTS